MLLLRPTAVLLLSCQWHAHPVQPRQIARRLSPLRLAASKGGEDDALADLVAGLNAQLNDWSDFEEAAPPPAPTPGAGVSSKRAASGKSKAAKAYLRRGPKRKDPLSRLEKKRAKASDSLDSSDASTGAGAAGSDAWPAPMAEAEAEARTSSAAAGEAGWAAVGAISGATRQARVRIEDQPSYLV